MSLVTLEMGGGRRGGDGIYGYKMICIPELGARFGPMSLEWVVCIQKSASCLSPLGLSPWFPTAFLVHWLGNKQGFHLP